MKQKKKNGKGEGTYRLNVGRERIAHDIRITSDTLPSKTIRTINVNCPREM